MCSSSTCLFFTQVALLCLLLQAALVAPWVPTCPASKQCLLLIGKRLFHSAMPPHQQLGTFCTGEHLAAFSWMEQILAPDSTLSLQAAEECTVCWNSRHCLIPLMVI
jgi:hypothetical protein